MTSSKIFGVATMPRVQRNGRYLAILFAFLMAAALYSFAQEATIVGTVTDPSGATIPNVTITATRVETGEVRTSVTNDTGGLGRQNLSHTGTTGLGGIDWTHPLPCSGVT